MKENEKKLEEIRKKVTETKLIINRIPLDIKREFINLANSEEFLGDYGFCMKFLMDFRKGLLTSPNLILAEKIDLLEKQVEQLMSVPKVQEEEKKPKVIRALNGRIIKVLEE